MTLQQSFMIWTNYLQLVHIHFIFSRYFSLRLTNFTVNLDLCKHLSVYRLQHSIAFVWSRIRIASFRATRNRKDRDKAAADVLKVKQSRACFICFLHHILTSSKSFPMYQRKIDSLSLSGRIPPFKQTRYIEE